MNIDVLAIGAHPDDLELGIGGLLHRLARNGCRIAMLDLTRGEMSTRGTVEERAAEAAAAAAILKAVVRESAGLPDGAVTNNTEQQRAIIPFLRRFRPKVVFAPMGGDRHPDHTAAHALVRDANYFAGLGRIETGDPPCRAPSVLYYFPYYDVLTPAFVVDISEDFAAKEAALKAHASQFFNPEYQGAPTMISSARFWHTIETRAAYWGGRIGVDYAETLYADGPVSLDILSGWISFLPSPSREKE